MTKILPKQPSISTGPLDVSKTPGSGGPVPIPYPSSGVGHDALVLQTHGYTKTGATNLAQGKPPAASLDRFRFASSHGNEAGTLKGMLSVKADSQKLKAVGASSMAVLGRFPAVKKFP
jgi:uncharacterized protein DUF4150